MLGLAGPRMANQGVRPIVEFDRLPVTGLVEVLPRLPFFLSLRRRVERLLETDPPDLVIPIDYPGFNLWLAREAHGRGVKVLVYIAPQVWAWRPGRMRALAEDADRVAVVFPQEEAYLREHGVDAHFVGHPLIDRLAEWPSCEEALARANCDPDRPVLGLLPGSRVQEVKRHLGVFLEVARRVTATRPAVQVVVAEAGDVDPALYAAAGPNRRIADSRVVLRASTAALTKAGTTTVEAACAGTPFVVAHRVQPLTYLIGRRLVKLDSIVMVNLLAGRRVVPEFVQDLPVDRIARALEPLLDRENTDRAAMLGALGKVRQRLGGPGAAERAARLAGELLESRR